MDTQEPRRFVVQPQHSVATSLLIECLKGGESGDEVTDEELFEICHKATVSGANGYGNLQSAIRYCLRQGVVWQRVRGEDKIRCLDGPEKLARAEFDKRGIRRRAKRSVRVLGSIDREKDFDNDQDRRRFDVHFAQQSTIAVLADSYTTRKLEAKTKPEPVDRSRLLELFS